LSNNDSTELTDEFSFPDEHSFPHERYEPLSSLGAGSIGAVYKCLDKVLKRVVAVKTLKHLTENQIMDFQREARVLSTVQHPGIVGILDFGVTEKGHPFLVMEYVEGETLADLLDRDGPPSTSRALEIFAQVTDALAYAHSKSIFHRDIKPTNIYLQQDKFDECKVKLIDFGIAAIMAEDNSQEAQGRTIVGTPLYMSPDQVKGEEYHPTSEVYTVCCVLFETIIGIPPFTGTTPLELFSQHANNPAPSMLEFNTSSIVFPRLDEIVRRRGLAKVREERFASMEDLHDAIVSLIDESKGYEHDSITYGAFDSARPGDPNRERELRSINVRYTVVFIACLVAVISVIPVIAFALINQSSTHESRKTKIRLAHPLDVNSLDELVGELDKDGVVVRDGVCKINGTLDPKQLIQRAKGHEIERIHILGVHLTPKDARAIVGIPCERLDLVDCAHTDEVIKILSEMKTLESLYINFGVLSDLSMQYIAAMPGLRSLDLRACSVSDKGVGYLADHPRLTELAVKNCKTITGEALKYGFDNLKQLRISGTAIKGEDLDILKHMKELAVLDAAPINVSDNDLKQLEDLPIRRIKISGPKLTIEGLRHLLAMPQLEELESFQSETVTRDSIKPFREAKPRLHINLIRPARREP